MTRAGRLDRRTLAAFLAGSGVAYAATRFAGRDTAGLPGLGASLAGAGAGATRRLAILGTKPSGRMPYRGGDEGGSVLTLLELSTGVATHVALDFPEAHALVDLGAHGWAIVGNHRVLTLTERDFRVRRRVEAPEGREFGGHAVLLADGARLVVGLRTARSAEESRLGELAVVDVATGATTGRLASGGYEPHDLRRLADGRLVVANYGNKRRADLQSYEAFAPTIALFDGVSLSLEKIVPGPSLGALSHLAEGPRGTLALLPAALATLAPDALASLAQSLGGAPADLSPPEILENKIGRPAPILTLELGSESWRSYLVEPAKQRRPQSIAWSPRARAWFVAYPFSDQVARLGVDGSVRFRSGFELGLAHVRGVAVDPVDGDVFVSGQFRGICRIDAEDLALLARVDVPLFDAVHVAVI